MPGPSVPMPPERDMRHAFVPLDHTDANCLEALVYEFSRRVDNDEGYGVEDLFTTAGCYEADGAVSTGRAAIAAAYAARRARGARLARHVITNLTLFRTDHPDLVCGSAILTLFAADGVAPLPWAHPIAVSDVRDLFERAEGAWLFRSRVLTRVFFDPDHKTVLALGR